MKKLLTLALILLSAKSYSQVTIDFNKIDSFTVVLQEQNKEFYLLEYACNSFLKINKLDSAFAYLEKMKVSNNSSKETVLEYNNYIQSILYGINKMTMPARKKKKILAQIKTLLI